MIDRLRKRFIRITMGSVAAVLVILMVSINLSNYLNADQSATERLEILADNDGAFPGLLGQPNQQPAVPPDQGGTSAESGTEQSPALQAADGTPDTEAGEQGSFSGHKNLSPETPYETRYFSVVLKADGALESVNTGKIAAISSEEAVSMTEELAQKGRDSGYTGNYKFLAQVLDDGNTRYIFLDCTRDLQSARAFLRNSLLVSLCGFAAVLVLVLALSKRAIRPVAESYEKQKQFITNAGHEIKTPLTIIDSCTEVLEMEQGENKWTQGIRGQVRRLTALTQSLVSLTRMDEAGGQLPMENFSLSDTVRDALEPFALLAESSGLVMEQAVEPDVTCRGNEPALRQLVSILADNAVKYALPGSTIHVSLTRKGKKAILTSKNQAEGLEKGDQNVLFDRFYRGDVSRSSEKSGYGIGLSMARSIVTAHGGIITAFSEDGQTLTITAQL